MDKAKLITRLMNTFLDELQGHVRLNRESLALEKNPAEAERARRLQELLRTAHSLKGTPARWISRSSSRPATGSKTCWPGYGQSGGVRFRVVFAAICDGRQS